MSLRALYAASTGMEAQESKINAIANNLANINTAGFKADHVSFEDLMYDQVLTPGANTSSNVLAPVGIQVGHGTKVNGLYKSFSAGEFTQSNRELDVAIEGNGFFRVTMEDGSTAYTRDGSFKLDSTGQIVDTHGNPIDPTITVPSTATSITIGQDGTISAAISGQSEPQNLGQLTLSIFANPAGLRATGKNQFAETAASGSPTDAAPGLDGAGTLIQGFLENSNVNVAEELINMIVAQRSYEANSKVLQSTSEMMRQSNNIL